MKNILFTLSIVLISSTIFAQNTHDPKAKKILDRVSAKMKTYKTIRVNFKYIMNNKAENITDSYKGYAFLKDKKYKLILPGREVFCDGKSVYTYAKSAKEMTIDNINPDDNSILNPKKMLTIYENGFKYRYRAEVTDEMETKVDGKIKKVKKDMHLIDLYPENVNGTDYSMIKILIERKTDEIVSVAYIGKNGTDFLINILEIKTNSVIKDDIFKLNKKRYPAELDIIDLR